MKNLIGRKILNIEFCPSKDLFRISTDQGPLYYEAYGECCSSTYVEWVNHSCMIGATVIFVEDKKAPDHPEYNENFYERVDAYGHTIMHSNGYTDVYSWNVSNGYYSGYLMPILEQDNYSTLAWKPVGDWDV